MNIERIVIVDDERIIRESLRGWFLPTFEVFCFDSSERFLDSLNQFDFEDGNPTCMLLDFQMPGMNGVELQQTLKSLNVEFPIIFMSGNARQVDIIDAWHGGAVDFILKPFNANQISQALLTQFDRLKQRRNHENKAKDELTHTVVPITKREAEVLLLLGKGLQQNEVARILGISLRTVKSSEIL